MKIHLFYPNFFIDSFHLNNRKHMDRAMWLKLSFISGKWVSLEDITYRVLIVSFLGSWGFL